MQVWRMSLDKVRNPMDRNVVFLPVTGSWMLDLRHESSGFSRLILFERLGAIQIDIPYSLHFSKELSLVELRFYKSSVVKVRLFRMYYIRLLLWLLIGLRRLYRRRLRVSGRGYKMRLFPRRAVIVFRLGYTHVIVFKVPSNIFVRLNKKCTKLYLFSINKALLSCIVRQIFLYHPSEVYTGNGLIMTHKVTRRKPGKTQ